MLYEETFEGYKNKLKGRLYGVLCEKEKAFRKHLLCCDWTVHCPYGFMDIAVTR
jgi:hypothetical protein